MSDPVIELVQLENGEIALRRTDAPEEPLLTLIFSDQIKAFLQSEQIVVAHAMVEAGITRYKDVQMDRVRQVKEASENGLLH